MSPSLFRLLWPPLATFRVSRVRPRVPGRGHPGSPAGPRLGTSVHRDWPAPAPRCLALQVWTGLLGATSEVTGRPGGPVPAWSHSRSLYWPKSREGDDGPWAAGPLQWAGRGAGRRSEDLAEAGVRSVPRSPWVALWLQRVTWPWSGRPRAQAGVGTGASLPEPWARQRWPSSGSGQCLVGRSPRCPQSLAQGTGQTPHPCHQGFQTWSSRAVTGRPSELPRPVQPWRLTPGLGLDGQSTVVQHGSAGHRRAPVTSGWTEGDSAAGRRPAHTAAGWPRGSAVHVTSTEWAVAGWGALWSPPWVTVP